jgi:DnaJ-class molecular chaperone
MWQKCPICNGTGINYNTLPSLTSAVCTVCKGTKIISELTGLPPNNFEVIKNDTTKNIDYKPSKDSDIGIIK